MNRTGCQRKKQRNNENDKIIVLLIIILLFYYNYCYINNIRTIIKSIQPYLKVLKHFTTNAILHGNVY